MNKNSTSNPQSEFQSHRKHEKIKQWKQISRARYHVVKTGTISRTHKSNRQNRKMDFNCTQRKINKSNGIPKKQYDKIIQKSTWSEQDH